VRTLAAVFVAIGFVVVAPEAGAKPRALLDVGRDGDVAIAGDDALVGFGTATGRVKVMSVPLQGGRPRQLLSLPAPGRRWTANVRVAASAQRVAALFLRDRSGGPPHQWDIFTGPLAGPLGPLISVTEPGSGQWVPTDIDVDRERLLVGEAQFPSGAYRLTTYGGTGGAEPIVQSPRLSPPVALARNFVTYVGWSSGDPKTARPQVRIADRLTAAVRATITLRSRTDDVDHLDLRSDGRVIASVDGKLLTAAPGSPQRRVAGGHGRYLEAGRFAGRAIAALEVGRAEMRRPVLLNPRSGALRSIGPRSTAFAGALASSRALPVAASGRTLAWLANGCLLTTTTADTSFEAPPRGPCPRAEVLLGEDEQVLRGRATRVAVRCVAAPRSGCRGVVILRGTAFGRGRFSIRRGRRQFVRVLFSRRQAALVRRAVRRDEEALFEPRARVVDGRVSPASTSGVLIERVLPR
jgi:hypothetical protein